MKLRCNFTGDLCGTNTRAKYQPCVCAHCQRWLCEESDKLQTALAAAKERERVLRDLLDCIVNSSIEFEDERLPYVVMQIDKKDLEKARAALAAKEG